MPELPDLFPMALYGLLEVLLLLEDRRLPGMQPLHPANYTIKIMSGMKDEKLQGLSDVGIRIEKQ